MRNMITGSLNGVLELTDGMTKAARDPEVDPLVKLHQLDLSAAFLTEQQENMPKPDNAWDYLMSLRLRTYLACLPSLRTTAANMPHSAEVSKAVLENLAPVLEEATIENTNNSAGFKTGIAAHGQIAEMAVLGTLLYAHSTNPERATHSVLPASPQQDKSSRRGRFLTGFDLILDMVDRSAPIQVKSSVGPSRKSYVPGIAIVTLGDFVDRTAGSRDLAPQLLAHAVIDRETEQLDRAIQHIDRKIEEATRPVRRGGPRSRRIIRR